MEVDHQDDTSVLREVCLNIFNKYNITYTNPPAQIPHLSEVCCMNAYFSIHGSYIYSTFLKFNICISTRQDHSLAIGMTTQNFGKRAYPNLSIVLAQLRRSYVDLDIQFIENENTVRFKAYSYISRVSTCQESIHAEISSSFCKSYQLFCYLFTVPLVSYILRPRALNKDKDSQKHSLVLSKFITESTHTDMKSILISTIEKEGFRKISIKS